MLFFICIFFLFVCVLNELNDYFTMTNVCVFLYNTHLKEVRGRPNRLKVLCVPSKVINFWFMYLF